MKSAILYCIALSLFMANSAHGQSWSKWMGPNGDNTWNDTGIIDSFPKEGPRVIWRQKIGSGYSGPAVANGMVIITDFKTEANVKIANFERREFDGEESITCLDEATGEVRWQHKHPVRYTISYPSGPRCTPIIEGDRVYTLGSEGHLFCFNADDGKIIWSKELKKEYQTKSALWGYAAHPVIVGDMLITLAGGQGSHMVALNKMSGEEIWKTLTAPEQGYAQPTLIDAGDTKQLVTLRPDAVTAVNPENGKELWSVPYEATSNSIIMSPIAFGKYLYAAGYSNKSMLLKYKDDFSGVDVVWQNQARIASSPVNVQPYFDMEQRVMYGVHQNGDMRATRFNDDGKAELLWATSEPISKRRVGNGTAFIVRQANTDRFWLFNESGELIISEMTPDGYKEIDRAKILEATNNAFGRPVVWSMPAFANRRAYVRNDDEIICLDLAK